MNAKHFILLLLTTISVLALRGQVLSVNTSPADSCYRIAEAEGVDYAYVTTNMAYITFSTADGRNVDWYDMTAAAVVASGFNTFSPEDDGHTYRVTQDGLSETFVVFDYSQHRLSTDSLTADLSCESTVLTLHSPQMTYRDSNHVEHVVNRHFVLSYQNLLWGDNGWSETAMADSVWPDRSGLIVLGKQLCRTSYTLTGDRFTEAFYNAQDSIVSDEYEAIAYAHHAQSYTTTRGTSMENEVERPIQETTIKGSAPLNILFKANASTPIEYYLWRNYHYDNLMSSRTESEERIVFEERGSYQVTLDMENSHGCHCDTAFEDIAISESLLMVPNVFTPNGDGMNDEFRVAYRSIKEFRCWVYNRWGHLVYYWEDPAKGWDGTINGRPAPEGAYYYVIRALGTDAAQDGYMNRIKYGNTKKKDPDSLIGVYQLSGDINLIRGKR